MRTVSPTDRINWERCIVRFELGALLIDAMNTTGTKTWSRLAIRGMSELFCGCDNLIFGKYRESRSKQG